MESTNESSLFGLSLDHESIDHLTETARWGKFLAIVGFVSCGFIIIMAFVVGALLSGSLLSTFPGYSNRIDTGVFGLLGGAMIGGLYSLFAVIYFFPCLFLYKFSVRMKAALSTDDQVKLNQSLKAQKFLFRYVGIATIIGVALGILELLAVGVFALVAVRSR
jgi:uncharacterized membrane protein YjgN (DUF898 family)